MVEDIGQAYIQGGEGELNKEIKLEIVNSTSGRLVIGMGDPTEDMNFAYIFGKTVVM